MSIFNCFPDDNITGANKKIQMRKEDAGARNIKTKTGWGFIEMMSLIFGTQLQSGGTTDTNDVTEAQDGSVLKIVKKRGWFGFKTR